MPTLSKEVWLHLLGPDNIENGTKHFPFILQRFLFCVHSDISLLDTESMPEIESGTQSP